MKQKVIGVDLGSTLSEVCIIENGKPVVVVNEEGGSTTPSIVSFKDDTPKVGASAKRQMVMSPKLTINLIKRFMGGTYDEVTDAINHVQYDVKNVNGMPMVNVKGRDYSPQEISSYIIAKLKKTAEDYLGEKVTDAVITVPAFFSDAAKAATKQAGELAGLNVLRIISEPTAALLASNIDKKKSGKYLVVDYGGSTLDNSVADISDDVVEILASYGDVYLGGTDIDKVVSDWMVEEFKKDKGIDLSIDTMAMSRIIEAAEKAKIELTSTASTEINLPYITAIDGTPQHLVTTLTRAKFEQLITSNVEKVINCSKKAVEKAHLSVNDIDGVLLVGGSCRIPLVQQRLIEVFGDKLIKSANLDLAVAEGAAIQANILAGGDNANDILLLDVTPLGLGIETMGGVMTQIIEANTTIPCKRSQVFSTAQDNQPAVTVRILQGERPMANDNKEVGMFTLDGIMPAKRGVPQIEVTFDIDANGLIKVSAVDKATNKEQHITIENKGSLSADEIERIKSEAKEHEAEDAKKRKELEQRNKCDSCIYQTENQMESMKEHLTEDDKSYFNGKIEEMKKMNETNDYSNVDNIVNEVTQRWYGISAKAYQSSNPNNSGQTNASDIFNQFGDMFGQGGFSNNGGGSSSTVNNNEQGKATDADYEEV